MNRRTQGIIGLSLGVALSGAMSLAAVSALTRQDPPARADQIKKTRATPRPVGPSYAGSAGRTVLELLTARAVVSTEGTGKATMVTSINGQKADITRHEYWGFRVNGSVVGRSPASVVTRDGDQIEWRLEKY